MSHWAEIDGNNTVLRVLVGDDSQGEQAAYDWLMQNLGGVWIQTSYNGNIRKNYAGIGFTYDAVRDAFIAPQPYPSWSLNEATCRWEAPVPYPDDGNVRVWDEATLQWVQP